MIRFDLNFLPKPSKETKKSINVLNRQHVAARRSMSSMDARLLDEPPAHRNLGELVGWFQPTHVQ